MYKSKPEVTVVVSLVKITEKSTKCTYSVPLLIFLGNVFLLVASAR